MFELRRAKKVSGEFFDNEYLMSIQRLDADNDLTRNLINNLIEMGTRKYIFTGSGEPFLHNNALEFMGLAKRAGSTCIVNTNGTLLDHETVDELIKMRFDELRINTLAGSRDTYLRTHPGVKHETFNNLRDNLVYLAEKKAEMGVKFPKVSLVYIVIPQNSDAIYEFAEFSKFVKADRAIFMPVDTVEDPGLKKYFLVTANDVAVVREQLIEVKAYLKSCGISHNIENFLKVFHKKLDTTELYKLIPCYSGWLLVRIDADGLVYPCCRCYEALGHVYENEFHEIWNGNVYRLFRKEAFKINKRNSPVRGCDCNSCPHYTANLKAYRVLHPVKGRSARLKRLSPIFSEYGK
jgi:radical SAM protein with 4Fe4S-binding SPASM domain